MASVRFHSKDSDSPNISFSIKQFTIPPAAEKQNIVVRSHECSGFL